MARLLIARGVVPILLTSVASARLLMPLAMFLLSLSVIEEVNNLHRVRKNVSTDSSIAQTVQYINN